MNQPRYSDNGSSNSWSDYPANRRSVQSTGRSNYGGSRGGVGRGGGSRQHNGGGRGGGGNPIGNWINNRRRRRNQRGGSGGGGEEDRSASAVGTEANALKNMKRNARHFAYPAEGFETPIEHSLLYAMIEFPERYPEGVVKGEIDDEDFEVYLYVNDAKGKQQRGGSGEGVGNGEGVDEGGSDQQQQHGEKRVSYAQLSALLSLSSEKNPSTADPNEQQQPSSGGGGGGSNNAKGSNSSQKEQPPLSIGQALCRKLLRTITRYSDANGLDRQTEISEFLSPIEKRCQMRNEKAALQQLLPAYAGYTLSLVTGNPLPLLIGAAALTGPDPMVEENCNVSGFRAHGGRVGDMETAGLLDECDSD